MDARTLAKHRRWLVSESRWVPSWLRRAAANALARAETAEAARVLAELFSKDRSISVQEAVGNALRRLTQPRAIDSVCAVWAETRSPRLASLLQREGWKATAPVDLRVLTRLRADACDGAPLKGDEIESIVRAIDDVDPKIAARAVKLLSGLAQPDEIEVLCEVVMRSDDPRLRKLAVEKGYAPQEPGWRALFYFLTQQWDRYESLDFDRQLLRSHYEAADDRLRQAIAGKIRASGRPEYARVLHGRRDKRHIQSMSSREWEAIVAVLTEKRRYDDLWTLIFEAPLEWSSEALVVLRQAGYRPKEDSDAAIFDRLSKLRPVNGKQARLFWPVPVCRKTLRASGHGIRAIAFSPDAKWIASAGNDSTIRLWEVSSGQVLHTLGLNVGSVLSLAFSPDGRQLAAGLADHTVRLWETLRWQMIVTLHGHTDRVMTVAFSPDGTLLASAGFDQTGRLWDLGTKQCRAVLSGHSRSILTSAFTPDAKFLATGAHDETVRLWHTGSGETKTIFSGYAGSVCAVAITPDGKSLVAGSSDGMVRMRHIPTGDLQGEMAAHKGTVAALALSGDGKRLATGGLDRTVRLWDVPTRQVKATLTGHLDEVNTVAFAYDGKALATGSRDRSIRIWDLALGKPMGAMTQEDLNQIEQWAQVLSNHEEARGWHYVASALRHRFRSDIELEEVAGKLFSEFDIELAPATGGG